MNKVRAGYKMTELGEIPIEWEVKRLEECTNKITDGSHTSPAPVVSIVSTSFAGIIVYSSFSFT